MGWHLAMTYQILPWDTSIEWLWRITHMEAVKKLVLRWLIARRWRMVTIYNHLLMVASPMTVNMINHMRVAKVKNHMLKHGFLFIFDMKIITWPENLIWRKNLVQLASMDPQGSWICTHSMDNLDIKTFMLEIVWIPPHPNALHIRRVANNILVLISFGMRKHLALH